MPIRDERGVHIPTEEDKLIELSRLGIQYAAKKKEESNVQGAIKKGKEKIVSFIKTNEEIFDVNGKHLEVTAPAGDGLNEVFIQLQRRESYGTVDNVIDVLREKLGASLDNYVHKIEVLHENALEALFNNGLLTKADIDKLVTVKSSEVLIVKVNKKSS